MKKIAIIDITSKKINIRNKYVRVTYMRSFRRPFTIMGVISRVRKRSMILMQEDNTRITIGYRTIVGGTMNILENKRLK